MQQHTCCLVKVLFETVSGLLCGSVRQVLGYWQGQSAIARWPFEHFCVCFVAVKVEISINHRGCCPSGKNVLPPRFVWSVLFCLCGGKLAFRDVFVLLSLACIVFNDLTQF